MWIRSKSCNSYCNLAWVAPWSWKGCNLDCSKAWVALRDMLRATSARDRDAFKGQPARVRARDQDANEGQLDASV